MKEILVICQKEKDKLVLESVFKNCGAETFFADGLNEALRFAEKIFPRAVFIAEGGEVPAEIILREIRRVMPLTPLVVLLAKRDSSKALAYMKLGAFDCAQPPWTEEEIAPLFRKALSLYGTEIKFPGPPPKRFIRNAAFAFLSVLSLFLAFHYGSELQKKNYEKKPETLKTFLPDSKIAGIFFSEDGVYAADWLLQTVYKYDKKDLRLLSAAKLGREIPVFAADAGPSFLILNDDGTVQRRLKDEKLTIISQTKPVKNADGICFDGMYVWTLNKKNSTLEKRINNDELQTVYAVPIPSGKIDNFTCDKNAFFYYDSESGIFKKAGAADPEKTLFEMKLPFPGRVFSMASDGGTLWFIYKDGKKTVLEKLGIKDEI